MTPKEKADELFDKFSWEILPDGQSVRTPAIIKKAKECALICVNEILNEIVAANAHADIEGIDESGKHLTREDYFYQVKQEIEKL